MDRVLPAGRRPCSVWRQGPSSLVPVESARCPVSGVVLDPFRYWDTSSDCGTVPCPDYTPIGLRLILHPNPVPPDVVLLGSRLTVGQPGTSDPYPWGLPRTPSMTSEGALS